MAGNFKKIKMNLQMLLKKLFIFSIILSGVLALSGCGLVNAVTENVYSTMGLTGTGTVISGKVYIRSSYAVVAADLLEVKRGQQVEVLDETTFENTVWYRVRAFDEDETEGWIEAQYIIKEENLDKSRKLAEEDKTLQAQAIGQLRAATNLRLLPEQKEDNILLQLDNGATFEIIDWQYVKTNQPKEEEPENEDIKAAEENKKDEPAQLDETYDVWYKVRLDPSVSPAPLGWIYGKQTDLQVPSDIVYYQTNDRKFVAWQRLDDYEPSETISSNDSGAKVTKPGSWLVLTRTNDVKAIEGVEPDFDNLLILGYDKYNQEHYTAYSTHREKIEIWGKLPLKVEGTGDNKTFTVKLRNEANGEMEEKRFVLFKDKSNRLRVTPPEFLKNLKENKKKK
jgi:hypothetical protein